MEQRWGLGFGQRLQAPVSRAGLRRWVPGADAVAAAPGRLCARQGRFQRGNSPAAARGAPRVHPGVPGARGAFQGCPCGRGALRGGRAVLPASVPPASRSPRGRRFPGERRPHSWLRNVGVPRLGGAAGICCCLLVTPGRSCARSHQPDCHVPRGAAGVVSPRRCPRRAGAVLPQHRSVGWLWDLRLLWRSWGCTGCAWVWCLLGVPALLFAACFACSGRAPGSLRCRGAAVRLQSRGAAGQS